MTADKKNECGYCSSLDSHERGCPELSGLKKDLAQWTDGYNCAWRDEILLEGESDCYSLSFNLGYKVGRDELDCAIEEAIQDRDWPEY